jgi:hypothetical protein
VKDTDDVAVLYMASEGVEGTLPVSLDGQHIIDLPATYYKTAFKIFPKNEIFEVMIGKNKFKFEKNKILNNTNKSFVILR